MPRTLILALLMLLGGASCSSLQGTTGIESGPQTVDHRASVGQVLLRRGARQEDRLLKGKGSKKAKGSKGPKKSKAPKGKGKGGRRDLRAVSDATAIRHLSEAIDNRNLKGSKEAKGGKGGKGTKKAKGTKGPKQTKAPKGSKGKGKGGRRDLHFVIEEHREEQVRQSLIDSKVSDRLLKGSKKAKGSKGPKKSKAPKGSKGKGKGGRRDLRVVIEEHREEQVRQSLIDSKVSDRLLKGSKKAKGSKGPKKSKAPKGSKGKGKGGRS